MHVWLVKDMEPVPGDAGDPRLLRAAMLSGALVERGHDVSWITSTFDHYARRHRAEQTDTRVISDTYRIEILRAPGYSSNISPMRIWHNRCFARAFVDFSRRADQRPDVIVTDIPTTETAEAAIRVARQWNIPTLLSIRDLWPDFFKNFASPILRPLMKLAVWPLDRQAAYACRNATAIIGISPRYLGWGLAKGGRQKGELDAILPLGYEVIPTSVASAEVARGQLKSLGVSFEKQIVSFVGSWGSTYDLGVVLDAAARLEQATDIQFVLAGDGDERQSLMKRIRSLRNVVAPGWLTANQIATLLEASTLGLMPYREAAPQGLPNKIFEYMAYGAFQISTLPGEAAELLADLDVGRTVGRGDAQATAVAISESLERGRHKGERERIRQEFLARFSANAIYSEMSERIENLARDFAHQNVDELQRSLS